MIQSVRGQKDKYQCNFRGKQLAKNKGLFEMYFVESVIAE